ncbi:MAG: glycosyltransferase [Planctomycetales bacterium]|nr:glycosyltransferase [Planctomycetales bacterium]
MTVHLATLLTAAALAALLQTFLLGCQSWEHRRRARKRLNEPPSLGPLPRVVLFAPCKGVELGLRENLHCLFQQDYPEYEIVFVVEDAQDAACETIASLIAAYPDIHARLVDAGLAQSGCQKVHNLRAATASVATDAEVYAFVDSDARPHAGWLRQIVAQVDEPRVGVVTGYRWFVPQEFSPAAAILYSINATAASLYTPKTFQPIWGGSWAMRRDVFERLDIAAEWEERLTDDLVATNAVTNAGLRVAFEPGCMIASPLEATWPTMFEFLRRQYLIGRLYARRWWTLALCATTLTVVGFWGGLVAAIAGWTLGAAWAWAPAAACAGWYAINLARAAIRRDLSRIYLPERTSQLAAANRFDAWAAPLAATVNWAAIVSSIITRRMTWRGIEYEVLRDGRARIVGRDFRLRLADIDDQSPVARPADAASAIAAAPKSEIRLSRAA